MEEDPLESVAFSQVENLKKRRFALEDSSPPCPVQVTGILIVTPPHSSNLEDRDLNKPPEQQLSQSISGSEDQGPGQTQMDTGNYVGGFTQAVDLGKDSVALGFSELNETDCGTCVVNSDALLFSEPNVVDCVKDVVCEPNLSKSIAERTVNVGNDSDTLLVLNMNAIERIAGVKNVVSDLDLSKSSTERMFSEVNVIKRIDGVKDVVSDCDLSKVECDLKGCKVLESECGQSVMNECTVFAENIGYTEPIVIENEIDETEVVDMVVEESCEEMGVRVSENTKNVEERVEGENSEGHSTGNNIEDYDAFEFVANGGADGRELLNSLMEPEENEGLSALQLALNDVNTIMDLLEAPEEFLGEGATDTDFLKAAMERGLTFHPPRWWPREGF